MRHVYMRGILALIWLTAAIVSAVTGSTEMAVRFVLIGSVFGYSAWAAWKKEKNGKRRS